MRRSSSNVTASAVPQDGQNRVPGGTATPQFGHVISSERTASSLAPPVDDGIAYPGRDGLTRGAACLVVPVSPQRG